MSVSIQLKSSGTGLTSFDFLSTGFIDRESFKQGLVPDNEGFYRDTFEWVCSDKSSLPDYVNQLQRFNQLARKFYGSGLRTAPVWAQYAFNEDAGTRYALVSGIEFGDSLPSWIAAVGQYGSMPITVVRMFEGFTSYAPDVRDTTYSAAVASRTISYIDKVGNHNHIELTSSQIDGDLPPYWVLKLSDIPSGSRVRVALKSVKTGYLGDLENITTSMNNGTSYDKSLTGSLDVTQWASTGPIYFPVSGSVYGTLAGNWDWYDDCAQVGALPNYCVIQPYMYHNLLAGQLYYPIRYDVPLNLDASYHGSGSIMTWGGTMRIPVGDYPMVGGNAMYSTPGTNSFNMRGLIFGDAGSYIHRGWALIPVSDGVTMIRGLDRMPQSSNYSATVNSWFQRGYYEDLSALATNNPAYLISLDVIGGFFQMNPSMDHRLYFFFSEDITATDGNSNSFSAERLAVSGSCTARLYLIPRWSMLRD